MLPEVQKEIKRQIELNAALLAEWKQEHESEEKGGDKVFISDGIISAKHWEKSPEKILFILKEAYDDSGNETEDWNLCGKIRNEWKGYAFLIWKRVAQWAYGILQSPSSSGFFLDEVEDAKLNQALLSSAIVNVKKSSGTSSSEWDNLLTYAKEDANKIRRQIEIINPDIVICGNTWWLLHDTVYPKDGCNKISEQAWIAGNRLFVDFWHPANRYPNTMNYYSLMTLVRMAKDKQSRK